MNSGEYSIRDARPEEFAEVGALMVKVYAQLDGFPTESEQPEYYNMLAYIGRLTENPGIRLLVAVSPEGRIGGGVVYVGDMRYYGSGGTAVLEKNAAGFRLLAVDSAARGKGVGRLLTETCIRMAKDEQQDKIVIHSTPAMKTAWGMYERMGFNRAEDLDFIQRGFPVFGFRLFL